MSGRHYDQPLVGHVFQHAVRHKVMKMGNLMFPR